MRKEACVKAAFVVGQSGTSGNVQSGYADVQDFVN